jgi:hypothetical protein
MAECVDWEDDGTLMGAVKSCSSVGTCGHESGPSQPMLCDCCQAKLGPLPMKITYAKGPPKPWEPPPHYKDGQCKCDCHDRSIRHIVACCDQTYTPRAKMVPHAPRPEPADTKIGDFLKFTMPVIRPPK